MFSLNDIMFFRVFFFSAKINLQKFMSHQKYNNA